MVLLEEGTDLTKGKTWPFQKWSDYLNMLFFKSVKAIVKIYMASASYQWLSGKDKSNRRVEWRESTALKHSCCNGEDQV